MDWKNMLRDFREGQAWSAAQAAREAGVSARSWQGWEAGDHVPKNCEVVDALKICMETHGFNWRAYAAKRRGYRKA